MNLFNKFSALVMLIAFTTNFSKATDLVVVNGGVLPQYSTIGAAIAAASNGDRILVTAGLPYNEGTLNINKNVQILSNTEGQQYQVSANITVTPPVSSSNIIIQGMDLIIGYIYGGVVPGSVRSKFTMVGSTVRNGYVDFYSNTYWDLNLMQDSIMGNNAYVQFRFGRLIGNYINAGSGNTHTIYVYAENTVASDSVFIVGNRIEMSTSGAAQSGIYWINGTNFFYIANNYIKNNNYSQYSMLINNTNTNTSGGNTIINNSFYNTSGGYQTMLLYTASSFTFVYNNLLMNGGSGAYGIYMGASVNNYVISYNHMQLGSSNALFGIANDGTNVIGSNSTFDINTGIALTGSAINGGYPNDAFADHDLTRNDAGCGGGSFRITNFHPMNNLSNGARVSFVNAPRRVLMGNNVSLKADSFDK
ncbi:MAG TPA: hypothetical protein PLD84_07340 [Chitinophagales bacterium]|nr:hypothetical protein [Chitinophagales bacterium]